MRKVKIFLDRTYNRTFNTRNCIKIKFYTDGSLFEYNDIITTEPSGKEQYRCLGKSWFVKIKDGKPV